MRLRVCRQPTGIIDGISLAHFQRGSVYDFGPQLGGLFLAEGWAEPVDGAEGLATPCADTRAARLLLVEDDAALRWWTAMLLTAHGYTVFEAQDGREAIGRLIQHTPDVVVLDLVMPVMNGWEFCAARQQLANPQLATIPVVLLSGVEDAGTQAATLGAVACVEKPFGSQQLLGAIQAAFRP